MKKLKTIGVIGGMGPISSAETYRRLVQGAQKKHDAVHSDEYPHIIVDSIQLPSLTECGIDDDKAALKDLTKSIKRLETAGVDFIIMPCNSAHMVYDELRAIAKVPFLSIVEETFHVLRDQGLKTVGLLSTCSTNESGVYAEKAKKYETHLLSLGMEDQVVVDEVIRNGFGGTFGQLQVTELLRFVMDLKARGAEAIILGCTELPLMLRQEHTEVKLLDTVQILVDAALEIAYGEREVFKSEKYSRSSTVHNI